AVVEMELVFAGDDAGEMEDHLGAVRDRFGGFPGCGQIGGDGLDLSFGRVRLGRADNIEQTQLVDWLASERAVLAEPFGQLAADHASRAGNKYVHVLCSLKRRGAV